MMSITLSIIFEIATMISIYKCGLMDQQTIVLQVISFIWYAFFLIEMTHQKKKGIHDES